MSARIKIKKLEIKNIYVNPSNDVCFSLASSPKDGRRQVMGFVSCKAFVHDAVTEFVLGPSHRQWSGSYDGETSPPIDMKKLRLLISTNKNDQGDFKKKLFAAKRMVNVLEAAAGWEPSKITTVDHETLGTKVWLLTGPEQWMMSPHMLSLVMLILRVGTKKGLIDVRDKKSALAQLEEWSKKNGFITDISYIKSCWQKLFPLMENFNYIFEGLTLEECYNPGTNSMHQNGIAYLASYTSGCEQLNKRLKEVCEKKNK